MSNIILTGERPTGPLHIGHYVGSLRNRIKLQNEGNYDEMYLFAADAQALTDNFDNPKKVRDNIFEVALDNLACGIDPNKVNYFIQSEVPELTELTFYYMNLVTVSRLHRNPTVKEEIKLRGFEESIPAGFFTYPVSQTADITAFKANIVPVGDDQLPMLEQAREIVRKFNSIYGETLKEPEALVGKVSRLKGLDGNKMSKSLGNAIYLKDDEETIQKKVMKATTDPNKIAKDDPANPDICMVYYYHNVYSKDNLSTICNECKQGKRGCVACKKELANNISEYLKPIREKRKYYEEHPELVEQILRDGTKKAQKVAHENLKRIKQNMKINYFE